MWRHVAPRETPGRWAPESDDWNRYDPHGEFERFANEINDPRGPGGLPYRRRPQTAEEAELDELALKAPTIAACLRKLLKVEDTADDSGGMFHPGTVAYCREMTRLFGRRATTSSGTSRATSASTAWPARSR